MRGGVGQPMHLEHLAQMWWFLPLVVISIACAAWLYWCHDEVEPEWVREVSPCCGTEVWTRGEESWEEWEPWE